MDFVEAKEYVDSLNRFGLVLGLDNIYELLERLGNPQDKVKIIHVAGTNGKGSTIAYISSILVNGGYKIGKYTSPVVFDYLEKYQINNENISEDIFCKAVEKVKTAVEAMIAEGKGQPTIFEVETAMAYLIFSENNCHMALIETGMGGDMDATNVCKSVLVSVIVSISLDHTAFLGNSLQEIAGHKAGIIKRGCPVVLYGQSAEVEKVISDIAAKLDAPLTITNIKDENGGLYREQYGYTYKSAAGEYYTGIEPSLAGICGIRNACTAIEVVEVLRRQGYNISSDVIKRGLATAVWSGRFEMICKEPCIIIDGAHNPDAVAKLKESLEERYRDYEIIFIMGVLADKDFVTETQTITGMAHKIITVTPDNNRALEGSVLADTVRLVNENVQVAESVEEAVNIAVEQYNELTGNRLIVAFGSLSYLGRLREFVMSKRSGEVFDI